MLYPLNEVSPEHIDQLKADQLTRLLHHLLETEAENNNLENWDRSVPFNITTGDGGSDGRIRWEGAPEKTRWLKNRFTIFQNKATLLGPSKCYEEILERQSSRGKAKVKPPKRKLKSQIEKLVVDNGCYVLFTNKQLTDNNKEERITSFRKAIEDAGHPNYSAFQIFIYDSNEIKDWVNKYISAVVLVQGFNGIERLNGFIIWEKWGVVIRADQNKFQADDTVKENCQLIQEAIKKENIIRINGHSGLGKTRLAFEAFRNSLEKNSLVYYNLEGNENISAIKNYIISYQEKQKGIIIIDNCDVKNHSILSALVKTSGTIKIISIGLDDDSSLEDLTINIERNNQREIVKQIVVDKIGKTHQSTDIEYINSISEGYPWMAIKFCDAILKDGLSELYKIPIDNFIQKLIFGVSPEDKIEYDIIRACSVFSSFGFLDDSFVNLINPEILKSLKEQMDFIRTNIYDGEITETRFRETCNKFLSEDIIEKRGIYYIVKPTILAINLAADWLISTEFEKIKKIIQDLKKVNLDEKFLARFKDLDQIDKAKEIVKDLWGSGSFFTSAEVLNTSWGSLLFRYVVEVNPIATSNALQYSFGKMSKSDIFKIVDGRRNLVWALEKLCFRKETFNTSSRILYSFAVSENERWSNNSTYQFVHLFQLFLSGTEVPLIDRLEIIDWGLLKGDDDYTRIAILALGNGLPNDRYSRTGGAEKQGSKAPLRDHYPNWDEIIEYWNKIISTLTKIACSHSLLSDLAQKTIAGSIRNLIRDRGNEIIINSIRQISKTKKEIWTEAINNLKKTLDFERQLPKNILNEIETLIDELSPTDIKNQLLLKVSKPQWETFEKDSNGNYIDKQKINAEKFALKLVDEKISWEQYIEDLLSGEQRQAFNFGNEVGRLLSNPKSLIDKAIKSLKSIPKKEQNPELIAGIVSGAKNKKLTEKVLDKFIGDDDINQHAFYLTRLLFSSYNEIERLFILIDKKKFKIEQFNNFQYGRALDNLQTKEVLSLCIRISQYDDMGNWTALSLLFMYCHSNEINWKKCKKLIKKIIQGKNLIIENNVNGTMEGHHWSDAVIKILKQADETAFAIKITNQIIEFCSQANFKYSFDIYVANVTKVLFDKYFQNTWDLFGNAIIGDYMTFFHLENLIGSKNGSSGYIGIAFQNENNFKDILAWCRKNVERGPERIAHMMPLADVASEEVKWHPLSKQIIDEFASNEKVLQQLASNMGTYSSINSSIPYFNNQKKLLQELLTNKNQVVKDWAISMLDYTEKTIKREKLDDENHFVN